MLRPVRNTYTGIAMDILTERVSEFLANPACISPAHPTLQ